jgi:hypothetical protein
MTGNEKSPSGLGLYIPEPSEVTKPEEIAKLQTSLEYLSGLSASARKEFNSSDGGDRLRKIVDKLNLPFASKNLGQGTLEKLYLWCLDRTSKESSKPQQSTPSPETSSSSTTNLIDQFKEGKIQVEPHQPEKKKGNRPKEERAHFKNVCERCGAGNHLSGKYCAFCYQIVTEERANAELRRTMHRELGVGDG